MKVQLNLLCLNSIYTGVGRWFALGGRGGGGATALSPPPPLPLASYIFDTRSFSQVYTHMQNLYASDLFTSLLYSYMGLTFSPIGDLLLEEVEGTIKMGGRGLYITLKP